MKRFCLSIVLAIAPGAVLLADASSNDGDGHAHHHEMSPAKNDLGSSAVFDRDGAIWVVHKRDGKILVQRSSDLGKTWSDPVAAAEETTDGGADSRPKIAVGQDGEIYVTWTHPLGKPYTGAIRFTRSLDHGRTFEAPRTVQADTQEITHRFDALIVDPMGRVFVAWIDKRDMVLAQAKKESYVGAAVYYAVSDDRGKTFRGDYKLADHSCECCRIALAMRPDGAVVAMWRHVFDKNIRDHAFAIVNPDGAPAEVRRATHDGWAIDACPHHGPAIAEDAEGKSHAVWFTQAPNHAGVFYGEPTSDGLKNERKIGDETAERPDVACVGNVVVVVWKQFDGEKSQLCGLISRDRGATWAERKLASTAGASDHPKLLVRGAQAFVFWNTRNEPLSVIPFSP